MGMRMRRTRMVSPLSRCSPWAAPSRGSPLEVPKWGGPLPTPPAAPRLGGMGWDWVGRGHPWGHRPTAAGTGTSAPLLWGGHFGELLLIMGISSIHLSAEGRESTRGWEGSLCPPGSSSGAFLGSPTSSLCGGGGMQPPAPAPPFSPPAPGEEPGRERGRRELIPASRHPSAAGGAESPAGKVRSGIKADQESFPSVLALGRAGLGRAPRGCGAGRAANIWNSPLAAASPPLGPGWGWGTFAVGPRRLVAPTKASPHTRI